MGTLNNVDQELIDETLAAYQQAIEAAAEAGVDIGAFAELSDDVEDGEDDDVPYASRKRRAGNRSWNEPSEQPGVTDMTYLAFCELVQTLVETGSWDQVLKLWHKRWEADHRLSCG